jgi:spoIIIJ-associated protein
MLGEPAMRASYVRDGKLDRESAAAEIRRCVDTIVRTGRFHLSYRVDIAPQLGDEEMETAEIVVNFDGPDKELLLERNGDLLKALEHIAVRWLRLEPQFHNRVRFDCGTFRASRIAELKLSAEVAAARVRETHEPFRFQAMAARDRRIIHLALKDQQGVRTTSEGEGEMRQVVIFPADSK